MNPNSLESALINIGFSRIEVACLLYLARTKKASTKRISRDTNTTYNLAKVMLKNLTQKGLLILIDTPDQDTYEFAGTKVLKNYLDQQKTALDEKYEAVQVAIDDFW